ncbi:FadR/GntR family transcriptional regulator [Dyella mobilis]|uniref:FadR family transcriptional regulator n=1 Tax=Dyella mobilis TaxID=1849582 RepID=A0ABS2KCX5_9GAMM|nr:FadR/GntR family transcriptional regulator [Dyella mobilis]MBM7129036.1 FadR family transcriptional regulator [Dyella mobilis]GLQ99270.1 GntR family transcriptional regulator [Dyella mobilis]
MRAAVTRNLHGHVTRDIGVRIVSGELRPGDVLPPEEVLAKHMAVSRGALREAMRALSAKGLVETKTRTGTRVRKEEHWQQFDSEVLAWRCASMPTADFVKNLAEMCGIFEPAAAALASRRCTAHQFKRIESAYKAMESARSSNEWAAADFAFHEAILRATDNELMISLLPAVEASLGFYFSLPAHKDGNFKHLLPYYYKLCEAIWSRNPTLSRQAMQDVISIFRAFIVENSQKQGRCA